MIEQTKGKMTLCGRSHNAAVGNFSAFVAQFFFWGGASDITSRKRNKHAKQTGYEGEGGKRRVGKLKSIARAALFSVAPCIGSAYSRSSKKS